MKWYLNRFRHEQPYQVKEFEPNYAIFHSPYARNVLLIDDELLIHKKPAKCYYAIL